jgi:hypothetical protein
MQARIICQGQCDFNIVKCVTSGNGFKEGSFYASIGWNNGIGVQRNNEQGDCTTMLCISGGVGIGDINNPDNSGRPSFEDIGENIIITEDPDEIIVERRFLNE